MFPGKSSEFARRSALPLLLSALVAACAVYDPSLLGHAGEGGRGSSTGGSAAIVVTGGAAGNASEGPLSGTGASGGANAAPAGGSASLSSSGGAASGGLGDLAAGVGGVGGQTSLELELVDDFETPDIFGVNQNGRKPLWYLFNDMTSGTQQPALLEMTAVPPADAAARPGSLYALYTSSTGFSDWGSGVGVDMVNEAGKKTYDASAYVGISFYAKAPSAYRAVRINVPDVGTDPAGQVCSGSECNDHFGISLLLTSDWQRYEISFADMRQQGFGSYREGLTLTAIYGIHFLIAAGKTVELWVDDLSLITP
ncbi:MAG TPA: carbohydrate binding domain-containing protein [Polyangiaceae bacterium]|nr:carbohydrate binding domain-containing protein [Polyangiaceae bacterium]